jgi:chemotaxis protein methyltransferase CheR
MLEEMTPGVRHTIIGTDLDDRILKAAREGRYLDKDIRNVPKHLVQRFFEQAGSEVTLSEEIRQRVTFRKHDLLKEKYEGNFDLILCRNVVIYFTNDAKDNIYLNFWEALNDRGIFFVGGAESILNAKDLGFQVFRPFFYTKVPDAGGLHVRKAS